MEANELFSICEQLASGAPSAQARRQLHELLSITAAHGCRGERWAFGNLFSQVDFLCRRLGISDTERQEIQAARRNSSRRADSISAAVTSVSGDLQSPSPVSGDLQSPSPVSGDLQSPSPSVWLYDVRAVALLVSAVFRVGVPGSLRRQLPPSPRPREKGLKINKRYVRCIVRHHDDNTIWADTGEGEITVDYGTTEQGRDFAYLRKILRPDMQLNLLDCHVATPGDADGDKSPTLLVTPTVIIVEPDFLIDISSLAACFTAYGHHPLLYTLNRLKPRVNNQAALLGNFAGVALDLLVHSSGLHCRPLTCDGRGESGALPSDGRGESRDLGTMVNAALKRAFREDTLRYLSCPDFDPVKFKQEAQRQMTNIAEAVDVLRQEAQGHGGFLLEPSFVCEQLGLQGRVDLMTTDMSLLVEQKSGKNMKIEYQSHDSHGLQLEAHYVQLLLYYATLRYNFQRGDRDVATRLLYSRYEPARGLLVVNYYRTLLREALKLRNQIVATELLIARDGYARVLPLLNDGIIYKDVPRDGYFHRYVLPELSLLTSHFSLLTPLERLYFERMMTFVYREQVAARLGSSEQRLHHSSGAASDLWLMPLDEKLETGNIYTGLAITDTRRTDPDGGYDLITLTHHPSPLTHHPSPLTHHPSPITPHPSNFRPGDMVYLYQYDGAPDVRCAILYKGTLSDIADGRLTVTLTDGQQNAAVFNNDRSWAIEHGGSDASTSGSIRSLFQFVTASPSRRTLLLGQRAPQADTSIRLSRSYSHHYDDILLRASQARDYFLLVGPPGTGKTSMALRFMVQECTTLPSSLLLMAYTNRAVDEICDMLEDAGFDYLRVGNAASCDPRFRKRLLCSVGCGSTAARPNGTLAKPVGARTNPTLDDQRALVERTPIIVATTSMLLARPFIFDVKHFSLAIVDEASQILEPGLIGLLAGDHIDRFVLIGDHKQLPAVVQQAGQDALVTEPELRAIGLADCRQSLFQRLYQWELSQGRSQFIGTLTHQGRMHPDVALFPNRQFYDGHLLPVPIAHQTATSLGYDLPSQDALDELLKTRRVLFLDPEEVPITPHPSPITPHPSPITPHPSLTTPHPSPTTPHPSPLTPHPSPITAEARLVADLLRRIHRFCADRFDADKTVGVIVPYRSQIAAIRNEIEKLEIANPQQQDALRNIAIDTVERFQGSQRDVIIYSFAVSHLYQLDFLTASTYTDEHGHLIDRKLNVALTRARKQMIMVGSTHILRHNPLFNQLIQDNGNFATLISQ